MKWYWVLAIALVAVALYNLADKKTPLGKFLP
jgi:hypothetical protein